MTETTTATIAEFSDPPEYANGAGRSKYHDIAHALKARPGEWARLNVDTKSVGALAGNIRRGTLAAFGPDGSFEAVTRAGAIWARYVGGGA